MYDLLVVLFTANVINDQLTDSPESLHNQLHTYSASHSERTLKKIIPESHTAR